MFPVNETTDPGGSCLSITQCPDVASTGLQLPPDLQTMIHTLLSPHKYYIPHKKLVGEILATRGIRQGSKDGPILWTLCMHLVLTDLAARYSYQWIHEHVIIYADDVHLRWRTSQLADGLTALSDLDHILRVFRMYGFSINLDKSVVLFRAVGKGAHRLTKRWIVRTKDGPFLTMPDSSIRLPMVSKTAYLGVIIGYRAWEMDTVARRAQAAHMCFSTLRKWLTAQCVPQGIRFRLYHQCIVPTLMYGIHEMGITQKSFCKIISIINVHFRRMIRAPVHLTHESTQDMFCRLNQPSPWAILQSHNLRLRQSLLHKIQQEAEFAMDDQTPDVIVLTPDYPMSHLDTPSDSSQPHAQDPSLECPECHRQFNQAGILKRHMRQMHHIPCLPEDVYNPLRDSFDGTSVCRHCMIQFSNMTTLRTHINKRVCTAFDLHQAWCSRLCPDLKWPCTFVTGRTCACTWISHCAKSLPLAVPSATNRSMPRQWPVTIGTTIRRRSNRPTLTWKWSEDLPTSGQAEVNARFVAPDCSMSTHTSAVWYTNWPP